MSVPDAAERLFAYLCPSIRMTDADREYYEGAIRAALRSQAENKPVACQVLSDLPGTAAVLGELAQAGSALQVHPSELMGEIARLQEENAALRSQAEGEPLRPYPELLMLREALKTMLALFDDQPVLACTFSELQQAIWSGYAVLGDTKPSYEITAPAPSPPMTVQLSPPTEDERKHLDGLQKTSHSPPMNEEDLWVCTGCGTRKSMEQIKGEQPQALSCCPERRMMPVSREEQQ